MNLKPLYRNESKILVGLKEDFAEVCVIDGLVVEVDIEKRKVVGDPVSGLSILRGGSYKPIRQSEKRDFTRLIERKIKKRVIKKIEEQLFSPAPEAISSLSWLPERLGGGVESE